MAPLVPFILPPEVPVAPVPISPPLVALPELPVAPRVESCAALDHVPPCLVQSVLFVYAELEHVPEVLRLPDAPISLELDPLTLPVESVEPVDLTPWSPETPVGVDVPDALLL